MKFWLWLEGLQWGNPWEWIKWVHDKIELEAVVSGSGSADILCLGVNWYTSELKWTDLSSVVQIYSSTMDLSLISKGGNNEKCKALIRLQGLYKDK